MGVGGGVYQLTKHGVGAFSESLRQEVTAAPRARRRWSSPARPRPSSPHHCARRSATQLTPAASDEPLQAEDIADAIAYIVTRPRHVAINEVLVRPTEQVQVGMPSTASVRLA